MWHDRFISSRFVFPLYDVPEPLPDGENSHSIAAVHALQYFGLLDRALVLRQPFIARFLCRFSSPRAISSALCSFVCSVDFFSLAHLP